MIKRLHSWSKGLNRILDTKFSIMELGNYLENLKSKGKRKPNSERAYWIELTAQKLGIPFEKVLWKSINWKTSWVKDMYLYCEHQDNFGKAWWGMIKRSKNNGVLEKAKESYQLDF